MANNYLVEVSPSTPLPCIPLHLSGFQNGDTIHVQGDTHNLQFSLQFTTNHNNANSENHFHFPSSQTLQNPTSPISSSSSYKTPITTHVEEDQNVYGDSYHAIDSIPMTTKRGSIVTRLRSGVLSPVSYRPQRASVNDSKNNIPFRTKRSSAKRRKREGNDVLERVIRRHSFPIRPCSSYSFFVIATWGATKLASFGETSKKLGEMWCTLPQKKKKVYEDMALQDNKRYRRQCMLLRAKDTD